MNRLPDIGATYTVASPPSPKFSIAYTNEDGSVIFGGGYTIRAISVPDCKIQQDVFDAVQHAVAFAMIKLDLSGHLFVTIVPGGVISTGQANTDYGFAMYHSGIRHVVVAGGEGPEELTREEWVEEVKISTIHEVVHYMQELNGTLDQNEEREIEAEETAVRLHQELKAMECSHE